MNVLLAFARILRRPAPRIVLTVGLVTGSQSAGIVPPASALTAACTNGWAVVSSPNVGSYINELHGVAAISATNAWAVGIASSNTLIEHWNGTAWSVSSSPNPSGSVSDLNGVTAVSSASVWAVGVSRPGANALRTLIEHWNGSTWKIVPSPNTGPNDDNRLTAVAAVSPTDVWAVGYSVTLSGVYATLTEHWNGTAWTIVPSPSRPFGTNSLSALAAFSSADVWAVGSGGGTLTEHWDGAAWSIVPSQMMGQGSNSFEAAAGSDPSNLWAIGNYDTGGPPPYTRTLAEHWDGSAWTVVSTPDPGALFNELLGAVARSGSDVWTVGSSSDSSVTSTLIQHWDGASWVTVASPNASANENVLFDVAAAGGSIWAVGREGPHSNWRTLVEQACPIPPSITGFSPPQAGVRQQVVITGTDFTGAAAVRFNGTLSTFSVDSDTQITAVVPNGATTGPISVSTPGGTATSSTDFRVKPKVKLFAPASGPVGALVSISGTALTGATKVTFNGVKATSFTVISYTQIQATVPAGSSSGRIAVTTPGGTAKSKTDFIVS